ncbi:MAG TPA: type II toxin-antitoxin system RelE/ParE family toxin [Clostridiales bacterium]|jgi:toxin ParE1/3/4|nr:type II toxin-antitoxin system RelE/ParE family toxin [Clostridiales bacterium]HRT81742.1 type II toxin-antitoxin system RelE/ParE family toxin [Oscillospiraceae bacterium]
MSEWNVFYTEQAEQDLRNVFEYIAFSLREPEIAKKQTKRIMDRISSLKNMPFRCRLYEHEPWKSKGLRVAVADNYLVLYLPDETEKTVAIIRIMYGARNIVEQL